MIKLTSLHCLIVLLLSNVITLAQHTTSYSDGLKFCEATLPYKGMILVSNFGGEQLNPLNTDGQGYIMAIDNDKVREFIPADGNLSAPKGMTIFKNHLFIADVGKVVVYNLKNKRLKPQVITFVADDFFVNDITVLADMLLVTVTNTGRIYSINLSDVNILTSTKPSVIGVIPGANGIAVHKNRIYVASYDPNNKASAQNVIYYADITNPNKSFEKLIPNLTGGLYDGIALNKAGTKIYFTSWSTLKDKTPSVYVYNVENQQTKKLNISAKFTGPADITLKNNTLWIPDLPRSKVHKLELK